MESIFEQIIKLLDENNIKYELLEHAPVRTSQEAASVRGVDIKTGAKSMILKAKDNYYMFIVPADKRIDSKKARKLIGANAIRFATEEEAEKVAHVKMGSVPPFPNVLGIEGYFDERLFENVIVNFNPGSVTHTIRMKSSDLKRITDAKLADIT